MRHIWPIVILASALLAATCDMVSSLPGPDGGSLPGCAEYFDRRGHIGPKAVSCPGRLYLSTQGNR